MELETMKILLEIQGTRLEAILAAEDRHVRIRVLRENDRGRTIAETHEAYRDRVEDWYQENGGGEHLAPWPAGTLMSITEA
jgi:alkanesulfonate monooxygenase SsuD/methylene tetrahydromethanopterin reductase-like flavin-dependent oxidoreductase (luciferase family)